MDTIHVTSAKEMLATLRPSNERWWNAKAGRPSHVFRGHRDATWRLQPSGWRPWGPPNPITPLIASFEEILAANGVGIYDDKGAYTDSAVGMLTTLALLEGVYSFAALARRIGLEMPWTILGTLLAADFQQHFDWRPLMPDLGLLSLAQHHGVPTWLLDWSEDPLTAAFSDLGDENANSDFCVWALTTSPDVYYGQYTQDPFLRLSWVSTSGNEFIRAQSGVFLGYMPTAENAHVFPSTFQNGRWPAVDEDPRVYPNLTKVVCPASERAELRDLLLREGRSEAHLKPSLDAVAATVIRSWRP